MTLSKELIFVYNSDSGILNAALDSLHKIFSPNTYSCYLCAMTHGTVGVKKEWRNFINALPLAVSFRHRDQWQLSESSLPAVFINVNGDTELLISASELKDLTLIQLMQLIKVKLNLL